MLQIFYLNRIKNFSPSFIVPFFVVRHFVVIHINCAVFEFMKINFIFFVTAGFKYLCLNCLSPLNNEINLCLTFSAQSNYLFGHISITKIFWLSDLSFCNWNISDAIPIFTFKCPIILFNSSTHFTGCVGINFDKFSTECNNYNYWWSSWTMCELKNSSATLWWFVFVRKWFYS